ncbi:hypothetical protein MYSTI_03359 [Myxococcus stipitatus DSM 14675]|uniref:Serine protease n=1 Tax=Myxococcus stipitatus (strain DSM 14675 / JCM 12634 / Mx s8) TaxID=1278073 RepID=L7U709_MYXSD|nr:trypsin-like peptidase domain-containing protein [Myxococcus stipitatus]AGC44671.1 hypothetical protein MYSTI_03359 [Myxococcus stipitatus DSM 14675]
MRLLSWWVACLFSLAALAEPADRPGTQAVSRLKSRRASAVAFHVGRGYWVTVLHALDRTRGQSVLVQGRRQSVCETVAVEPRFDVAVVQCVGAPPADTISLEPATASAFNPVRLLTLGSDGDGARLHGAEVDTPRPLEGTRLGGCGVRRGALLTVATPYDGESGSPLVVLAEGVPRLMGVWSGRYQPPDPRGDCVQRTGRCEKRGLVVPSEVVERLTRPLLQSTSGRPRLPQGNLPAQTFFACGSGRIERGSLRQTTERGASPAAPPSAPRGQKQAVAAHLRFEELKRLINESQSGPLPLIVLIDASIQGRKNLETELNTRRPKLLQVAQGARSSIEGLATAEEQLLDQALLILQQNAPLRADVLREWSDPKKGTELGRIVERRSVPDLLALLQKLQPKKTPALSLCVLAAASAQLGWSSLGSAERAYWHCQVSVDRGHPQAVSWSKLLNTASSIDYPTTCSKPTMDPGAAWDALMANPKVRVGFWLALERYRILNLDLVLRSLLKQNAADPEAIHMDLLQDHAKRLKQLLQPEPASDAALALSALESFIPDSPLVARLDPSRTGSFLRKHWCSIPGAASNDPGLTEKFLEAFENTTRVACTRLEALQSIAASTGQQSGLTEACAISVDKLRL